MYKKDLTPKLLKKKKKIEIAPHATFFFLFSSIWNLCMGKREKVIKKKNWNILTSCPTLLQLPYDLYKRHYFSLKCCQTSLRISYPYVWAKKKKKINPFSHFCIQWITALRDLLIFRNVFCRILIFVNLSQIKSCWATSTLIYDVTFPRLLKNK